MIAVGMTGAPAATRIVVKAMNIAAMWALLLASR